MCDFKLKQNTNLPCELYIPLGKRNSGSCKRFGGVPNPTFALFTNIQQAIDSGVINIPLPPPEEVTISNTSGENPNNFVPALVPTEGDEFHNRVDDTNWIYDGNMWVETTDCLTKNIANVTINEPYEIWIDNLTGGQTVFNLDTTLTGLTLADVSCVEVYHNGFEQPDSNKVPVAALENINSYTFTTNGSNIEITFANAPGDPGAPCYIKIKAFVKRTLKDLSGC